MNRTTFGHAAIVSLALGTATIGCTPSAQMDHVASASDRAGGSDAARYAAKARRALDRHQDADAVRWAERATTASPTDADQRMLLGQAYLGAGRFASAAASFRDALTIAPDRPRAGFDLALAQIAMGLPQEAQVTLAGVKGRVPDADLGLALALAGDRPGGIAMLTAVVRAGNSDARARQNLALALALDGQWDQARGLAMQDTPPDRLEAKLAGWRTMAADGAGARQVAAMLGTVPAIGDPGRPTRLALVSPAVAPPAALALAAVPAMPVVAMPLPVPLAVPVPVAISPMAPVRTAAVSVVAPIEVAQAMPAAEVPMSPAAMPALLTAPPAARPAPSYVAPHRVRTVVLADASAPAKATVSPGAILHSVEQGGFVVQLGAYARSGAIETAWSAASRLSPNIATLSAVKGSTLRQGATLVRLSIGGFASRGDARTLCGQIKARGGACFVRAETGDRPWQWARKDTGTQVAMR